MNITSGTLLNNRYRITSVLGQGGMGAVYKAKDENLDIPVAVKENLFLTEEYSRQFQREANILASLRHKSLPRVRDYFTMQGVGQYLVMDFIEGEDLRQRIERMGVLSEEDVILIGAHICDALEHLHTRTPPIVHRDIKPGNVKVTPEGDIVLVDFGLAKVMHDSNQATTTGARAMTPGYSPPEQYGTARTDARSDIYSLGATLYAALTGVIPEDGLTRVTGKTRLTPVKQLRPKINRKLAGVIETALSVEPEDRYQTAAEMKDALLEAGNLTLAFQEPKTVSPPPEDSYWEKAEGERPINKMPYAEDLYSRPPSRTRRRKRNRSLILALITTAVLVGAIILFAGRPELAASLVGQSRTTPTVPLAAASLSVPPNAPQAAQTMQPTLAVVPAANETAEPLPSGTPTPTETTIPSPTPLGGGYSQIAFSSDRSGNFQIWLMNGDGTMQTQVTNLPGGACQPAWSPDGNMLALISPCNGRRDTYPGANIYLMDYANKGEPEKLIEVASPAGEFDPTWSPDGRRLAFTSLRSGRPHIFLYDFSTKLTSEVSDTVFPDKHPAWSPSGKQLAYIRQLPNGQVWLMGDDGSHQAQFSPPGGINNLWPVWSRDGQMIYYTQTSVDEFTPWLVGMRYEDRSKALELRIPGTGDTRIGPMAKVDISPDGTWIAYESWPQGVNHDIYILPLTGSIQTRLTTDSEYDFGPTWRPSPVSTP